MLAVSWRLSLRASASCPTDADCDRQQRWGYADHSPKPDRDRHRRQHSVLADQRDELELSSEFTKAHTIVLDQGSTPAVQNADIVLGIEKDRRSGLRRHAKPVAPERVRGA